MTEREGEREERSGGAPAHPERVGQLTGEGGVGVGSRWRSTCGGSGQRGRARGDVDRDEGRAMRHGRRCNSPDLIP